MLERIILWGLVVSGHRKIGNYVRIDGRFVRKDKVVFDFIDYIGSYHYLMGIGDVYGI